MYTQSFYYLSIHSGPILKALIAIAFPFVEAANFIEPQFVFEANVHLPLRHIPSLSFSFAPATSVQLC